MPRNTREWAKQELVRAIGNLEWVKGHLDPIGATYLEHHPEVSNKVLNIIEMTDILISCVDELERSL